MQLRRALRRTHHVAFELWPRKKERELKYAKRRPETTNLYRIVNSEHERLEWQWEARFQHEFGFLRSEVVKAFQEYLKCGILVHGCARLACTNPGCGGGNVVAFSCKRRLICPSCAAKRALLFAEHLHNNILGNVPVRHMVFSIPKRLRPFFKYNRKLNNLLFRAGWDTIRNLFKEVLPAGRPGVVQVLQTAGESLNFNPHLHNLVTDGVLDDEGNFFELGYINEKRFTDYFARRLLVLLEREELITREIREEILSWKHSGFSVWAGPAVRPDDGDARCFIARYIDRGSVVLDKISIESDIITYETEDDLTHEFDGPEFLARLQQHLPSRYESVVRYYGAFSYRYRGEQKKRAPAPAEPEITPLSEDVGKKQLSRTWAALIKNVFEVDPLACPKCGSEMKIAAFLVKEAEILRLLTNLGIKQAEMPPRLRSPPAAGEYAVEPEEENQEYW